MNSEQLLKLIKDDYFYIYGTGHNAKRFFGFLKNNGYYSKCLGFISTHGDNVALEPDVHIHSVFDETIEKNAHVFICTHNVYFEEIKKILIDNNFTNYFWIYPYIFELEYGNPIERNVLRNPKKLISKMSSLYMLAIFHLAIDCHMGKNSFGLECHKRFHMHDVSEATATKILKNFEERIDKYIQCGVLEEYPVLLNEDETYCMDGNHKLVMANYFGLPEINCNMYRNNSYIEKVRTNTHVVKETEEEIRNIHSEEEAEAIIETINKFKQGV